ncbi:MAG: hypothetical protein Q7U04_02830 [Bacteriovorax sp.]|nr:hypothetical protein [Bacteriovorax sp.]
MKTLLLITCALFSNLALSCNSDYDCGYGNKCVKPAGSYSYSGSCVTPTDEYGQLDYNSSYNGWGSGYGAKEVTSCQFNTDCGIGFKCLKEAGQIYGLCTK